MGHWPPLDTGTTVGAGVSSTPVDKVDRGGDRMAGSLDFAGYPLQGIPWRDWTPTWTNLSVGNGTVVARYQQVDKLITIRLSLTFGSSTSISGDVKVSLPVVPSGSYLLSAIGQAFLVDTGTERFLGYISTQVSGSVALIRAWGAATTIVNEITLSSTVPFTWTTSDILQFIATYEAA